MLSVKPGSPFKTCSVDADCPNGGYCENDSSKTAPYVCHGEVPSLELSGRLFYDPIQPACAAVAYNMTLYDMGRQLGFSVQAVAVGGGAAPDRLILEWDADPEEQFFGFGEQYSVWNLRGNRWSTGQSVV